MPFEDTIIDVVAPDDMDLDYDNRQIWFDHLYLVLSKGYYIRFYEIFRHALVVDNQQPYYRFLQGACDMAFCYAFTSTTAATLDFLKKLLTEGKLTVAEVTYGSQRGKYDYTWSPTYYSYLPSEYRDN